MNGQRLRQGRGWYMETRGGTEWEGNQERMTSEGEGLSSSSREQEGWVVTGAGCTSMRQQTARNTKGGQTKL